MPKAALPRRRCILLACAITVMLQVTPAPASTVVPMNLATLSDLSGQAIVGRVASVRSYWAESPRRIESEVTFEQVEYLKGALPGSTDTFSLIVPGGRVDGMEMRVCCTPTFAAGDKWVLCLLPSYKTFPVAGLYQGAFLVQPDAQGTERVWRTRHGSRQPVTSIDTSGFVQVSRVSGGRVHEHLLDAVNVHVVSEADASRAEQAMSYEAFLRHLRPVLAASRDHMLSEPAGKPVPARYTAAPLRRSAFQRQQDQSARPGGTRQPVRFRGANPPQEVETTPRQGAGTEKEVRP